MAMEIKPNEINRIIRQQIENYSFKTETKDVGQVISVGDGIAVIQGLDDCMYGELLEFENGVPGMALNLEEDVTGCVLLGNEEYVTEGSEVKRTKSMVHVPVGEELIGRVVSPLGEPVDGKGIINCTKTRPIEFGAPGIIERQSVNTPLQTGIIAIDSMIPIGRGQRELIIGDRQTGKTAIAVDAIINQKHSGVICIYVAIGQKASTIAEVARIFEKYGAMEYTIIVCSTASQMPTIQYIAPYSGCAIAEHFMYEDNKDVLIVYDDLSKHAVAYRAMSLLLRRSPGREAYPGDVFYLHSRLLERAAKLNEKNVGGSITALPIIETLTGDVSAYIPTNVISITDGQIYLETELFFSGQRPAINVGLSVSRVGGAAQVNAMKKIAAPLRINLAQYRELSVFARFDSELDRATRDKLDQGERLVEIFKQPQNQPMPVEDQVIILYAVTNKYLSGIPVKQIKKCCLDLVKYIKEKYTLIGDEIIKTGDLSDETEVTLRTAVEEFVQYNKEKEKKVI